MSDSVAGRIVFNVLRVSFFVIVVTLFALAYYFNKDNLEIQTWKKTEAKIFSSQVVEKTVTMMKRKAISYDLEVEYAYIVDKQRYDSTDLFAYGETPKTLTKEYLLEQKQILAPNAVVDVYYNPENPELSYLITDPESWQESFYETSLLLLIIGIMLFVIPFVIGLILLSFKKEGSDKTFELHIPQISRGILPRKRQG